MNIDETIEDASKKLRDYANLIQDHSDMRNAIEQLYGYLKMKKIVSETMFKTSKIGTKTRSQLIACIKLEDEIIEMTHSYFPWLDP